MHEALSHLPKPDRFPMAIIFAAPQQILPETQHNQVTLKCRTNLKQILPCQRFHLLLVAHSVYKIFASTYREHVGFENLQSPKNVRKAELISRRESDYFIEP